MSARWTARHREGATTTLSDAEARAAARQMRWHAVWLSDDCVRLGDWTLTRIDVDETRETIPCPAVAR